MIVNIYPGYKDVSNYSFHLITILLQPLDEKAALERL